MKVTDFLDTMHESNFDIVVYENGRKVESKSVRMRWNLTKEALQTEWDKLMKLYPYKVSWIGITATSDDIPVVTLTVPLN